MNPGFYPASALPMAQYLADPCAEPSLSSGAAHRLITRSPAHVYAQHPRMGAQEQEDTAASDIGSIVHDLLLGGEGKICVIDPADYRSKPTKDNPEGSIPVGWTNNAIREARDTARTNGLVPILASQMAGARAMAAAARAFIATSELAGVLDEGEGESTMIWQEGETWFRARPDWMNWQKKVMLHFKTTDTSANPEPFIRGVMANYGYDMALAFYRRGFEALHGQDDQWQHVILAQEQRDPYACSLIGLSPVMMALADDKVERAVAIWRKCMNSRKWPAYSGSIHYAEPTAWQLAEAERMAQEAV